MTKTDQAVILTRSHDLRLAAALRSSREFGLESSTPIKHSPTCCRHQLQMLPSFNPKAIRFQVTQLAGSPLLYAVRPPGYHPRESNWRDFRHFTAQQLGQEIRPWLLDQGSLTQRLVKASHGHFQVQVLLQQWQRPRPSETAMLGMKPREKAIIREVALLCHGQPWVFARSVMPCRSLTGRLRRLRKFNNSSLGDMLFRDPSMRRSGFEIARIAGNSEQLPKAMRQATSLWGRRCRFELAAKPIMVSEVFLPAFRAGLSSPIVNR